MEIHLRVRGFRLQFAEMECTGVGQVIFESIAIIGATGVVCLTGVGHGGAVPKVATANVASAAVLKNNVVFGSVNANKRHWYKAGEALARPSHTILDQSPMDGRSGEGVDCRHHFAKEDMAL